MYRRSRFVLSNVIPEKFAVITPDSKKDNIVNYYNGPYDFLIYDTRKRWKTRAVSDLVSWKLSSGYHFSGDLLNRGLKIQIVNILSWSNKFEIKVTDPNGKSVNLMVPMAAFLEDIGELNAKNSVLDGTWFGFISKNIDYGKSVWFCREDSNHNVKEREIIRKLNKYDNSLVKRTSKLEEGKTYFLNYGVLAVCVGKIYNVLKNTEAYAMVQIDDSKFKENFEMGMDKLNMSLTQMIISTDIGTCYQNKGCGCGPIILTYAGKGCTGYKVTDLEDLTKSALLENQISLFKKDFDTENETVCIQHLETCKKDFEKDSWYTAKIYSILERSARLTNPSRMINDRIPELVLDITELMYKERDRSNAGNEQWRAQNFQRIINVANNFMSLKNISKEYRDKAVLLENKYENKSQG